MSHMRYSLVLLLGSFGAWSLFVVLAYVRLGGWALAIDIGISQFIAMLPDSSMGMILMKDVSLFGRELIVISVSVVSVGLLIYHRWESSIMLLGGVLAAGIINEWVRHRLEVVRPIIGHPELVQESDGFPSGHTMMATVTYGLLLIVFLPYVPQRLRLLVVGCAGLLILIIGISRLYLQHHYLSDVLGGYLAGVAWLGMCVASAVWLKYLVPRVYKSNVLKREDPPISVEE